MSHTLPRTPSAAGAARSTARAPAAAFAPRAPSPRAGRAPSSRAGRAPSSRATRAPASLAVLAGVAILGALGPLAACDSRSLGEGEGERECWDLWECNPGRLCGEMIDCVNFRCQTEDASVLVPCPAGECVRDSDCVVAQPFDCCNGCPEVATRAALGSDPELHCFYEQGTPPPTPPVDCLMDCFACPLCFPQPLGARCELGACVPTERGCPSSLAEEPPAVTVAEVVASPASYEGREVRLTGTLLPGQAACVDDCPSPHCCQAGMTLDGVIALQGMPCDLSLGFTFDDYCDDTFDSEGMLAGAAYEAAGTLWLNQSPMVPLTLELNGLRLADPSAEGLAGAFDVTVTQILSDASDPSCTPPTLTVGAPGRVYLAEAGGLVRAVAPMFDCHFEFRGAADPQGRFETRVPVVCDECCCDFLLDGEVTGTRIFGVYSYFDGTCKHEYYFEGVRDPLPHPDPPLPAL